MFYFFYKSFEDRFGIDFISLYFLDQDCSFLQFFFFFVFYLIIKLFMMLSWSNLKKL